MLNICFYSINNVFDSIFINPKITFKITMKRLIVTFLTLALSISTYALGELENFGSITYGEATNISGMQRMLSQRITKVYLLKLNGASGASFEKEYKSSLELFNKNFIKLSENSKESSENVKAAIKAEEAAWQEYMQVVIFKKEKNVNTILAASNNLLKKCHALVLAIESQGSKDGGNSEKINTVNVSGKQRMLSQRLGEYYAAIRLVKSQGGDTTGLESELKKVFEEVNTSYQKLSTSGLNTAGINAKFSDVKSKIDYMGTEKEKFFSNSLSINKISEFSNSLTFLYNEITGKYAGL